MLERRTEIVIPQDVNYLEIQKVLTDVPGIRHFRTSPLPENLNTILLDIVDDGQERRIAVRPFGLGSEFTKGHSKPFTFVTTDPGQTGRDKERNQELARIITSYFGGYVRQTGSADWQLQEPSKDRPTMSPRDNMAIVLSKTVGYVKAAMFHELTDDAAALDVIATALADYKQKTALIDGIELEDNAIPELSDYDDDTTDLKAVWVLRNKSDEVVELIYRLPEKTFDARVHPPKEKNQSFRIATEHEVALIVDTLPDNHREAINGWEHPEQALGLR